MKNIFVRTAAILIMAIGLGFLPSQAKAQATCPYVVTNALNCPIDLTYTIFCNGGWYTNTISMPPNSNYVIQCWEFPAICRGNANIEFNLLTVDNVGFVCVTPYSNTVAATIPNADASGMFPGAGCGSIFMDWYSGSLQIHP